MLFLCVFIKFNQISMLLLLEIYDIAERNIIESLQCVLLVCFVWCVCTLCGKLEQILYAYAYTDNVNFK